MSSISYEQFIPQFFIYRLILFSIDNCISLQVLYQTASVFILLLVKETQYFSSVQSLSHVQLFTIPWYEACQISLSITNSWSLLKLMSIESVMPSNRLILRCPLLFLPLIFPSIRVFSNKSTVPIKWPKYWTCTFSISPSKEHSGLISFRIDW